MNAVSVDDAPAIAVGQRILLVEDEMLLAMMIEDMLKDLGYQVIRAARIVKATYLAATEAIDGAILDVNVNGETVYAVTHELRRRGIPFIFSTGYGADGLRADYLGSPVLLKPFRQDDLGGILKKAIEAGGLKT